LTALAPADARAGDSRTPSPSARTPRRYRVSGDWTDHDFRITGNSRIDTEMDGFPDRHVAERLLFPVGAKECAALCPGVEEFRPSFSGLQVVELLEPGGP